MVNAWHYFSKGHFEFYLQISQPPWPALRPEQRDLAETEDF